MQLKESIGIVISLAVTVMAAVGLPAAAQEQSAGAPTVLRLHPAATATETIAWSSGVAFAYDGSGNIKKIGSDEYRYDVVGRLLRSETNGVWWRYAYDAYGNRVDCKVESLGADCQTIDVDSATNRLKSPAAYDAAGNVTALDGHAYSYDALSMQTRDIAGAAATEFVYGPDDERIAVHDSAGSWTWTVRDMSAKPLREFTSRDVAGGLVGAASWTWVKDYVWRDGLLLATRQLEQLGGTPVTYHYHLDHLGTPRRVTDDNDAVIGVHDYQPFGPELATSTNEPSISRLKFTGHERDGALDYMHARYYSGSMGRFLSVDPGRYNLNEPQSWNRYAYVRNCPLQFFDPDGREDKFVPKGGNCGGGGATERLEACPEITVTATAGATKRDTTKTPPPQNAPDGGAAPPKPELSMKRVKSGDPDYLSITIGGTGIVATRYGGILLKGSMPGLTNLGRAAKAFFAGGKVPAVSVMFGTAMTEKRIGPSKLQSALAGASIEGGIGSFFGVGGAYSPSANIAFFEYGLTTPTEGIAVSYAIPVVDSRDE